MRIAILPCSKTKAKMATTALHLYKGVLYRLARDYALETCDEVRIISAQFGLITPNTIVEPYDAYPISTWASSQYTKLSRKRSTFNAMLIRQLHDLGHDHTLVYLCNQFYAGLGPLGECPVKGLDFYQQRAFYHRWKKENA